MKTIIYSKKIPAESIIKDVDFKETNYEDAIYTTIPTNQKYSVDYISTLLFSSSPGWASLLLKLRNILVKPFGLKTDFSVDLKASENQKEYKPIENTIFFKIIKRSENELVMAENDKHLNFRTSVMIQPIVDQNLLKVYSITMVKFNNLLGKLYFLPVKHFHKLIIKSSLKNMKKKLTKTTRNENN